MAMEASGHTIERRGANRRSGERRSPYRRLDTLFAATLVNQIAPAEKAIPAGAYSAASLRVRRGIVVDVRV